MQRLRENAAPIGLLLGGLLLHFVAIAYPADVVWDETHFVHYSQCYLDRVYFFDIHPPLGKILIAGCLKIAGAPSLPDSDFPPGNPYRAGYPYIAARFGPALAGSLLPLLAWLLARALTFSPRGALLAGVLVLLENALLCISRWAMIDIFLHFFIFGAILAFVLHRKSEPGSKRWWGLMALTGLLAGAAASVKFPGLGVFGIIGVATLIEAVERRDWRIAAARAVVVGTLASAVYLGTFAVHMNRLSKTGAISMLTPEFRATLEGTRESQDPLIPKLGWFGRFWEINKKMYTINVDITIVHWDGSRWPEWLVGRKPVYFWKDGTDAARRIQLVGNPVVWTCGTLGAAAGFWFVAVRRRRLRELMAADPDWRERVAALEILVITWMMQLLPFDSISRAMFLYHYFSAYIAGILLGVFALVELGPVAGWWGKEGKGPLDGRWMVGLAGLALAGFVFVMPVTYGFRPFLSWQSALLPGGPP